jgi:Fe-Mn family superoxide dismutase
MFPLPDLPYDYDALEPVVSPDTLHVHHDKHHAKYVETTNDILTKAGREPRSLEEVVRDAAEDPSKQKLFNNAAQAWNHAFFWACMHPQGGAPAGRLAEAIDRDFGGLPDLRKTFVAEGAQHFGSGWVWLADDGKALSVLTTHDGEDLLTHRGLTPILVCDLWEHAYYLDYQQDREAFLKAWFDGLPNWEFAGAQFAAARGDGQGWRYPAPHH